MFDALTSKIVNQVLVPGSRIWKKEKRALIRRWKRAMLLPETVLIAGLILGGSYFSDHTGYRAGQTAMASGTVDVVEDGVLTGSKRKQRMVQDRLRANPGDVMVLTSGEVISAFSYPDLQHDEGTMTILQFRGAECVLDLYLKEGSASPVHYEFRPRRRATMTTPQKAHDVKPSDCIDDILKSRRV